MKNMEDFISRFSAKINFPRGLIVSNKNGFYLLNKTLKRHISHGFLYAGIFLGKSEKLTFLPSFNLLKMMAKTESNKVIVDRKTEWLFVCGRDVFKQGLVETRGSKRKGDYTLILNGNHECLGFGRILIDLDSANEGVVIKNILDIGDYLRREKSPSKY